MVAQRMKARLVPSLLVAALLQVAPLAFAKDSNCQFRARGLSMNFGALDPSSGSNVAAGLSAATLGADQAGDCQQLTMTIDGDSGQNGTRRLRNAAGTDFIPYALVGLPAAMPAPGNTKYTTFSFSGMILWNSYANATAGSYSDTVIISVTP